MSGTSQYIGNLASSVKVRHRYCSDCGRYNSGNWNYCPNCGTSLNGGLTRPQNPYPFTSVLATYSP